MLALLLLDLGRDAEARPVVDGLARDDFAAIYADSEWLFGMALAGEACHDRRQGSGSRPLRTTRALRRPTRRGARRRKRGAIDRPLGLLAATLGRLDESVDHLEAAERLNNAMGARPWVAHTQHDLAAVLRRRDGRATASTQMTWIGPHLPQRATQDGALAKQMGATADGAGPGEVTAGAMDATFQREGSTGRSSSSVNRSRFGIRRA